MSSTASVAIYGSSDALISVKELQKIAIDAKSVDAKRIAAGEVTQFNIRWPDLQVCINVMEKRQLPRHLGGFESYAQRLSDGSKAHEEVINQIRRIKNAFGLVIDPGWDDQGRGERIVLGMTKLTEGIFFAANSIYDGSNQLRLGPPQARRQFFIEKAAVTLEIPDEIVIKPESSPKGLQRKQRSEAVLTKEGIPVNQSLPVIEDESAARLRSKEEIAQRAIALAMGIDRAEGLDLDGFVELVARYNVDSWFTPKEQEMLFKDTLSEQEQIGSIWRYESCAVLLWALGYIRDLGRPDHNCDTGQISRLTARKPYQEFLDGAKLRPISEILDQADLVYRYAWAVRDAKLHQRKPPVGLISDVVYERHYTLNWLRGYCNQEWDDVTTDT
jgi:hypothetical protein